MNTAITLQSHPMDADRKDKWSVAHVSMVMKTWKTPMPPVPAAFRKFLQQLPALNALIGYDNFTSTGLTDTKLPLWTLEMSGYDYSNDNAVLTFGARLFKHMERGDYGITNDHFPGGNAWFLGNPHGYFHKDRIDSFDDGETNGYIQWFTNYSQFEDWPISPKMDRQL